jgi:uncharacterized membrane protein YphA (DoxX/SURF4 family)
LGVIALVVLRLTIGWHFFYEGVWKVNNYEKFSTTPFLVGAKGPAAPLYYWMVYDIDGTERLAIDTDEKGNKTIRGASFFAAWQGWLNDAKTGYNLDEASAKKAAAIHKQYAVSLRDYLDDNQDAIEGYFGALQRHQDAKAAGTDLANYNKKRLWDEQQKLRSEVKGWVSEINGMGDDYRMALYKIIPEEQRANYSPMGDGLDRVDLMNFAMTAGLTLMGLCLLTGFCTRLASIGAVIFLANVVLTQLPWPTIYPPMPPVAGHSMLIDKNFVEMIAALVLVCVPAGRWAGLDYFIYRWIGRPALKYLGAPLDPNEDF